MPAKILRPQATALGDFDSLVARYAEEMTAWAAQEAAAARGEAQRYPAPRTLPSVASAVASDGAEPPTWRADFELVDALPVEPNDPLALRRRKDELTLEVLAAEGRAAEAAHPPRLRRADDFRARDYADFDNATRRKIQSSRKKAQFDEIEQGVSAARSADHVAFLDAQEERRRRLEIIARQAAGLLEEIEELTQDNAHLWTMKPFPGTEDDR